MKVDREKLLYKPQCLLELLRTHRSVFVCLDSRRSGVVLPDIFMNRPQVVLELGQQLPNPIPDLHVGENDWRASLSFVQKGLGTQFCVVPWSAVYHIEADSGVGAHWGGDRPPDATHIRDFAPGEPGVPKAPKAPERKPVSLRLIQGGKR